MRKAVIAGLLVLAAAGLTACGGKDAEVSVPHVELAEQPKSSQTREQKDAELGLETEPGTVLGQEEVTVMEGEEPRTVTYTRVKGNGDFSLAYDTETFSLEASEEALTFRALDESVPAFVKMEKAKGASAEDVADQYVLESDEECTVEDVTVGEGEYPAVWVSYAEGTKDTERTCDIYVFRYNDVLYTVRMDCTVGTYEKIGQAEQMILSTLRFDEG